MAKTQKAKVRIEADGSRGGRGEHVGLMGVVMRRLGSRSSSLVFDRVAELLAQHTLCIAAMLDALFGNASYRARLSRSQSFGNRVQVAPRRVDYIEFSIGEPIGGIRYEFTKCFKPRAQLPFSTLSSVVVCFPATWMYLILVAHIKPVNEFWGLNLKADACERIEQAKSERLGALSTSLSLINPGENGEGCDDPCSEAGEDDCESRQVLRLAEEQQEDGCGQECPPGLDGHRPVFLDHAAVDRGHGVTVLHVPAGGSWLA